MRKHPQIPPPPQPELAVAGLTHHALSQLTDLQRELAERRLEALRLYEPMPKQEEFHRCMVSERLVIGGNRSGKSAATFVEDARAATGQDPHGKYPKEGGNLVIIGKNWQHIGMVVYPMLFKAGAFRIIRDAETRQWRAFRPGADDARKSESKPAPPLIPPRLVKDMAWTQKNAGYLNKAELHNGWTIYCFSSEGEPPQGFQADLVHIDEDLNNERWVGEMQARLADRKGRFVWSAMPHSKNDALLGLCERADKAEEDGVENPIIKKFVLRFLDNAHIDEEEKKKNIERWSALGVEEVRMRAEGEFTTASTLMYPTFNPSVHMLDRRLLPDGRVPHDWTRYVAIDPGHAVMATLFAAVPPDEKFLLIYDELYIRNCNALIWGEQFAEKVKDQHIHAAIMDMHGGALRDLGSGRLPHELYSEQLKKYGLKFQIGGTSFIPGSDDIPARTALVRQMLHIRGDGTTRLRFLEGACPNLVRELRRYRKKTTTVNGQVFVTDQPQTRGEVHASQCFDDCTEVLTEGGWKFFRDVADVDRVATVNLSNSHLEYQHFTRRIEKEYCGEMVRLSGARMDAMVTPDHRMVCLDKHGEYRIKEAGDLRITDRMTNRVVWQGTPRVDPVLLPAVGGGKREFEKEIDPRVWAEFLGWFLSEGYVDKTPRCPGSGYRVVISQKKPLTSALLLCNLNQLPFRWVKIPGGYQASSKQLWSALIGFGGAATKYVPDWILQSDERILRAFMDGAIDGDGWISKQTHLWRYGSISKRLADGIQEVMLKLGMSPSMRTQPAHVHHVGGRSGPAKEFYRVVQCRQRPIGMRDACGTPHFEPSHYEGKVYCLSVPNTTLVVRRSGMPLIAGNCLEYLCAYEPSYHAPPRIPGPEPWWVAWQKNRLRKKQESDDPCILLAPNGSLKR